MEADAPLLRSRKSPALKRVRAVRAGRERDVLLLEGGRLIGEAARVGLVLELLLLAEDHPPLSLAAQESYRLPAELLQDVSALRTSPGSLALARMPASAELERLELASDALVLVIDGVADPGNLGALARSCEAAGGVALAILPGGARPFGEKALRGSMGSLLRLPVVEAPDAASLRASLDRLGFRNVAAATRGGASLRTFDWRGRIALWIGAESGALDPSAGPLERVSIPMAGATESLNVTVAASLLLFAAGRNLGGQA